MEVCDGEDVETRLRQEGDADAQDADEADAGDETEDDEGRRAEAVMGEVVKFRRPRNGTIRGAARAMLTEAMDSVGAAHAVVIVTIGVDGGFAVRSANYDSIKDFDMYARAAAVIEREKGRLIE